MSNHTPEPWSLHNDMESGPDGIALLGAERSNAEYRANQERRVACVNACAGINPEAVPELMKVCEEARIELACVLVPDCSPAQAASQGVGVVMKKLESALAKAKEGQS